MSGYFSRKNDAPDTEPFRRFYAEGGYVGDTSHDIDDVEAGLYGSQNFAGGGKVGSLFKFVKNLVGTHATEDEAAMFDRLRKHTQETGNEASQLIVNDPLRPRDGILSEMSLGTPKSVPLPNDYRDLLSNPDATGTFAHTHPSNAMAPSHGDVMNFAHNHPWFNPANTMPDQWILGKDPNAALHVPRMDDVANHPDLNASAIMQEFYPQYHKAISDRATNQMMYEVEQMIQPLNRARYEATGGIRTREDLDEVARARSILSSAFPHNELRKGGLDMSVDPALEVFRPAKGEFAPLTIGQAWPELIDRLDTLGIAPVKTQDWRGYAEGGPVTDEDYGAYVSQYYADGGEVTPRGYFGGC